MKLFLLSMCMGLLFFDTGRAEDVSPAPESRIILGQIEHLDGSAWFIANNGSLIAARPNMKVFSNETLKAGDTTRLKLLNDDRLTLFPGSTVAFSAQGEVLVLDGQAELTLLNGEKQLLEEGQRTSIFMLSTHLHLMLDGVCHKIMYLDMLRLFIMANSLETKLPANFVDQPPEHELYRMMNEVLQTSGLVPFPSGIPFDCVTRDFYTDYFYTLLAEKFNWANTDEMEEESAAMTSQGYLNPAWAEETCICRAEALAMLWDAFLCIKPMAAQVVDPYAPPFPNLYEEPISPREND
jgi:hypothetical protein